MNLNIDQLMNFKYATQVIQESLSDGTVCYMAIHPELDGCMAHGDTQEEALVNLEESRRLLFETLIEKSLPIPLPENKSQTLPYTLATFTFAGISCRTNEIKESTIPKEVNVYKQMALCEETK